MTDTMEATETTGTDEAAGSFAERIFDAGLQAMELATIELGHRLGYYAALSDRGPTTAVELATATGTDERYTREWLEQQAVAGIVTVDGTGADAAARRYALPGGHRAVLLDEEHPAYMRAFVEFGLTLPHALPKLATAFRHGTSVPWEDFGAHGAQARQNRPMFANELTGSWLPAVPGLVERLSQPGARAADLGCGWGWSSIYLAEAFPTLAVDGYDVDDESVAAARRVAAERGVADRVRFELQDISAPNWDPGRYDLVLAVEMVHDLPDPVGCLRSMRRLTGEEGVVLIADEKVRDTFTAPGDELERVFYAFSVLCCTALARDGAATGTVMRPSTLRDYARRAGWADVDVVPIEHEFFRFYRPTT